jgi:hypothetical protein
MINKHGHTLNDKYFDHFNYNNITKIYVIVNGTIVYNAINNTINISVFDKYPEVNSSLLCDHCVNYFDSCNKNSLMICEIIKNTRNKILTYDNFDSHCEINSQLLLKKVHDIRRNESAFKNGINQAEDICLETVKQNGLKLEYVKEQTHVICLEAVKQNGLALKYVKEQTYDTCMEAVKQNGKPLKKWIDVKICVLKQ